MKKTAILILLAFVSYAFFACATDTLDTTTAITTEDVRNDAINQEYQTLRLSFPVALVADFVLPEASSADFAVSYSLDDVILTNRTITYVQEAYDREKTLEVSITYEGLSVTKQYVFMQVADPDLSEQEIIKLVFQACYDTILDDIPAKIYSDLTLPDMPLDGVSVEYSSDISYVFHGRFIYTYPDIEETVLINATLRYGEEVRYVSTYVTMASIDELSKIPAIYIYTEGGAAVESDEDYVSATMTVVTYEDNEAVTFLENAVLGIRLRGNSTLYMPKKPYKIKFEEKTAMFTDYARKDWVLLANYADQTLVRNYLADELSRGVGMAFSPISVFVDLYLNGEYQGNYMLTDQVEAASSRVDIEKESPNLDTGYLVELDKRLYDYDDWSLLDDNWFLVEGIPFVIKEPDWDDDTYSIDQLYYIQDYFVTLLNTLKAKADYTDLIDEDTFIDWFIIEEVMKNVDSGYSSVYFYKDAGGKLKMGPIWDFDLSSGNYGHLEPALRGPEGWYTSRQDKNIFFYYLMQYSTFRSHLKVRWNELYETVILPLPDKIYETSDSIMLSRYQNFEMWDVIGVDTSWYIAPEIHAIDTYEGQLWFLYDFLTQRIAWLNQNINNL
ncbi:MAG TPA: CotH kinase family protein [Bacillota bacterium]|nr:CotH kinase family protein [Bacillota bacterium]